jgi:dihydroxyacetone kinase-like protein
MDSLLQARLIEGVARAVIEHADELTALDQAIGDGDHGLNMKRGAEAVIAQVDALATKPLPEALKAIGSTLVMKVGGASGPLYGTLFMALARELPESPGRKEVALALAGAIAAVKKIGRSDVGQKTLLDVLAPAQQELEIEDGEVPARVMRRAAEAAAATTPMKATKGRASFLGDRSIGHMDPGARSSSLMIATVCQLLEE